MNSSIFGFLISSIRGGLLTHDGLIIAFYLKFQNICFLSCTFILIFFIDNSFFVLFPLPWPISAMSLLRKILRSRLRLYGGGGGGGGESEERGQFSMMPTLLGDFHSWPSLLDQKPPPDRHLQERQGQGWALHPHGRPQPLVVRYPVIYYYHMSQMVELFFKTYSLFTWMDEMKIGVWPKPSTHYR